MSRVIMDSKLYLPTVNYFRTLWLFQLKVWVSIFQTIIDIRGSYNTQLIQIQLNSQPTLYKIKGQYSSTQFVKDSYIDSA